MADTMNNRVCDKDEMKCDPEEDYYDSHDIDECK